MSFTIVDDAPARLNRSELAVPGSQTKFFEKAAQGAADVIFLDLEDAVAPAEKETARKNIVQATRSTGAARPSRCASTASTRTICTATSSTSSSRAATSSTSS
jgi:citrate lyase beta subunit